MSPWAVCVEVCSDWFMFTYMQASPSIYDGMITMLVMMTVVLQKVVTKHLQMISVSSCKQRRAVTEQEQSAVVVSSLWSCRRCSEEPHSSSLGHRCTYKKCLSEQPTFLRCLQLDRCCACIFSLNPHSISMSLDGWDSHLMDKETLPKVKQLVFVGLGS